MHYQNLMDSLCLVFLVLSSTLCLQFNLCNAQTLEYYSKNSTSSVDDISHDNLDVLISSLSKSPNNLRFSSQTVDEIDPSPPYMLFQCRGDVTDSICKKCKESAIKDIKEEEEKYPNMEEFFVFYDQCWLYYIENSGIVTDFLAIATPPGDPKWPNERLADFMSDLVSTGISSRSLYAKGNSSLAQVDNVYGLVQCNQNLSSSDCKECLGRAISMITNCCDNIPDINCCENRVGATILIPDCMIRYNSQDFFANGVSSSSPPRNPRLTSGKQKSSFTSVWIVSIIAGVILISYRELVGILSSSAS